MLNSFELKKLASWKALQSHFEEVKDVHMNDLFEKDHNRFSNNSIQNDYLLFDYSKNRITETTKKLLIDLAVETGLKDGIEKMFTGSPINTTENRSVLHTALRNFSEEPVHVSGEDVMPLVKEQLLKVKDFTEKVLSGSHKGFTGKKINTVVNIGIGGSDLGPAMVCEALKPFQAGPDVKFVSNVDGAHLHEVLLRCNAETTLFIIVSKTFTTQETMANANEAKTWLLEKLGAEKAVSSHFVAVSTNKEGVEAFGINDENRFAFWNWVGGRYSLWSSVGLSISLFAGYENFENLLKGAHEADVHFRTSDFSNNIPVLMALLGIWYNNFFSAESHAILPYSQYLNRFPAYLQQGDMESSGKRINRNGDSVDYQTGPIIWGEPGTNGQHAFYQLIHQGTKLIPSDFIAFREHHHEFEGHHKKLLANFLAQTRALMKGKNKVEVEVEIEEKGQSKELVNFKIFPGNIPTNSLLFSNHSAKSIGYLTACYEHKIFVQGYIWNILSFDQWGVELGKVLAKEILTEIEDGAPGEKFDSSTKGLLKFYFED